jgi:7-carboxy-7-deazaguanine synthase
MYVFMKLNIQSIFNSLDGEVNGFYGAGELCTFIRLRGCPLQCRYCDTQYAQGFSLLNEMEISDILTFPNLLNKVTITGGEPLFQKDGCKELIEKLSILGKRITIETNGSIALPFSRVDRISFSKNVRFVVDYKLPSSGVEEKMLAGLFEFLLETDVIKFVISDYHDYYIARGLVVGNTGWKARKVFSPAIEDQKDYTGWPSTLAQMLIDDANVLGDVQYSLQIHKVLFPNATCER